MAAVIFVCPTTKLKVQHWLDDHRDVSANEYRGATCPACNKLHLVNCKTGKLLGHDEDWGLVDLPFLGCAHYPVWPTPNDLSNRPDSRLHWAKTSSGRSTSLVRK